MGSLFEQAESISKGLCPAHLAIGRLACEGCRFQEQLQSWFTNIAPQFDHLDPYYNLALANYHALQLFLCKNYTFYTCWEGERAPSLTADMIARHTADAIALSDTVLRCSNIPGILLLFPLRMAGTNAVNASQKDEILKLLTQIFRNGFMVSERIRVDLREVWEYQEMGSG